MNNFSFLLCEELIDIANEDWLFLLIIVNIILIWIHLVVLGVILLMQS